MKNDLSHYSLSDLKMRLVLWTKVLSILRKKKYEIMNLIDQTGVAICFVLDHLTRLGGETCMKFRSPFSRDGLTGVYPETEIYKPKKKHEYTDYWWNPFTEEGRLIRVKVVQNIVKDFKFEIKKRLILAKYSDAELRSRLMAFRVLRSWFSEPGLYQNTFSNVDDLVSNSSICFGLRNLHKSTDFAVPDPNISGPGLKETYPEIHMYAPKTYWYYLGSNNKRNLTGYWWSPTVNSGRLKRIEVMNNVIKDLEKEIERRKS